jgi:hypothetical protein
VRTRENGRDELAFPAPVEESVHTEWECPQADVTGFLREGRSSLRQTTRKPGGERHRPVTRSNKWCGPEKPAAKPSHAPRSEVSEQGVNTVGENRQLLL